MCSGHSIAPVNHGVEHSGPVAIEQSKRSRLGRIEAQRATPTNTVLFWPSSGTCIFHTQRDFVYIVLLFCIFVLYSYILRLEFVTIDVSPFVKTMLFVVYRFVVLVLETSRMVTVSRVFLRYRTGPNINS